MDQATINLTRAHRHNHADPALADAEPAFIDQLVNIDDSQSLIDYVNRFKTADTVIFVDTDELEVHAVIDYHAAGSAKRGPAEHRAVLCLSHSHEWDTWTMNTRRTYDQRSFAQMLDVDSDDIANPMAANPLEMILRKIETRISSRGRQSADRNATDAAVPPLFLLHIPVFTGEPKVEVRAITIDNRHGKIGLELARASIIKEKELSRIAHAIASATGVPVMMGSISNI